MPRPTVGFQPRESEMLCGTAPETDKAKLSTHFLAPIGRSKTLASIGLPRRILPYSEWVRSGEDMALYKRPIHK